MSPLRIPHNVFLIKIISFPSLPPDLSSLRYLPHDLCPRPPLFIPIQYSFNFPYTLGYKAFTAALSVYQRPHP